MGKQILRSPAGNLWGLGVIDLGPHPVVVHNVGATEGEIRAGPGSTLRRPGTWMRVLGINGSIYCCFLLIESLFLCGFISAG